MLKVHQRLPIKVNKSLLRVKLLTKHLKVEEQSNMSDKSMICVPKICKKYKNSRKLERIKIVTFELYSILLLPLSSIRTKCMHLAYSLIVSLSYLPQELWLDYFAKTNGKINAMILEDQWLYPSSLKKRHFSSAVSGYHYNKCYVNL